MEIRANQGKILLKYTNSWISAIWWRKLGKIQNCLQKKLTFGLTHMKFGDCHGNVKNDGHTIDILKLPQRMKDQSLKVSAT